LNRLSSQCGKDSKVSLKRFVAVIGLVALAGCATLGAPPEAEVKSRAQARWNALLQGDTKAAYQYLSPGSRAVQGFQDYDASIRRGFWKSATVETVTCPTKQTCEVSAQIEYEFNGRRTRTPLSETWVREDGNWWLVKK
jgi:hypothetical protein